ncbi:enoyl-CoA hydratase-related protein [Streptomyces huasconensis]|uniref:Enoyl-CoA hydratase-related protein n=1 Tax=Streptomyces huasconensis TaxID=1854574 RepID=A0ABV3LPG9_9ACTN
MTPRTPTAGQTSSALVRLEVRPTGVGVIRLSRPPLNILDRGTQRQLHEAATAAALEPAVRAVVLHGGSHAFSAGADIREMAAMSHAEMEHHAPLLQAAFNAVADIPKPVIAAVNGPALGGGCELALCADYRICGRGARLGLPEVLLGVMPGAGGTQRLPRLIGPARAKELMMTGRALSGAEAQSLGLVDEVVTDAQVFEHALAKAERLADGPGAAIAAIKRAVDQGGTTDLDRGLALETELFAGLFGTRDRLIGMQGFLENGPGHAVFTHR